MDFGFVKVGAIAPEIKVLDVNYNVKNIIDGINQANACGVEFLVTPAMGITGSTIGDLVFSSVALDNAKSGLKEICEFSKGIKMLIAVGLPIKVCGLIYNVSAIINEGKVLAFIPKNNFTLKSGEEKRYFSSYVGDNTEIDFFGEKVPFGNDIVFCEKQTPNFMVAIELGEDILSLNSKSVNNALNGATIIGNLSSSNFTVGSVETEREILVAQSKKLNVGYVFANAGVGESTTDTVYAGVNYIYECGKNLVESKPFNSNLIVSDIDVEYLSFERNKNFNANYKKQDVKMIEFNAKRELKFSRIFKKAPFIPKNILDKSARFETILDIQAEGLKKRIVHTNASKLVLGLSGGLDSTLAILVAVRAMQKANREVSDVLAVTMPCFGTTSRTFDNTIKLAKALKVSLKKVDISKSVIRHLKDIGHNGSHDVTYENAQARERTQVLMDIANSYNGLVVGTGDLSELALGFATYNGDHMSMYGVNCSIPKTLVRGLVEYVKDNSRKKVKEVLKDILDTPVSPELLPAKDGEIAQKTEDIVGPYILHDFFLYNFIKKGYSPKKIYEIAKYTFDGEFDKDTILKWLKMFFRRFFNQQFKRSCVPDGVKVGSVSLSPRGDWKMPSDAVSKLYLEELENL